MRELGLVLPGANYPPRAPVLWCCAQALRQRGAEVRAIDYPSERPRALDSDEARSFFRAVSDQIVQEISEVSPERVTLVAKSLGTVVLAHLREDLIRCDEVRAIWLTPIFGRAEVRDGAAAKPWASLYASGAADPLHDADGLAAVVAATGGVSLVLDRADHALEVPGDVEASVAILAQLSRVVLDFTGA